MADSKKIPEFDFRSGVALGDLPDGGTLAGSVDGEDVVLARHGGTVFAVGAQCTHYHGALVDGLVVGDTVRCPLHHACFSLRTGEALSAPALDPIPCWRVEQTGGRVIVRERLPDIPKKTKSPASAPASVIIVGGGAAGLAAADMLRREGYDGPVTMFSADDYPP